MDKLYKFFVTTFLWAVGIIALMGLFAPDMFFEFMSASISNPFVPLSLWLGCAAGFAIGANHTDVQTFDRLPLKIAAASIASAIVAAVFLAIVFGLLSLSGMSVALITVVDILIAWFFIFCNLVWMAFLQFFYSFPT